MHPSFSSNTFEKGPFLLVRFLWANKENEQDKPETQWRIKMSVPKKYPFRMSKECYFLNLKMFWTLLLFRPPF
jgi:hypothetical protein